MSLRWTSQCYSCFSIFPTPFKKHLTKRLLLNPIKTHWFTYRLWCYCRVKVWAPFWVWKATNLRALTLSCQSLSSKFHQSLGLSLAQALKSQQSHPRNIHPGTIPPQETLYEPVSCSVPWYFSHKLRQILSCVFPNKFLKWYIWSLLCSMTLWCFLGSSHPHTFLLRAAILSLGKPFPQSCNTVTLDS